MICRMALCTKVEFKFIDSLKLENLEAWSAHTIGVLYGWNPASCSWGCSDIGLVLPIDGGIVAFSIVL